MENIMENENNNYALKLLKALRAQAGRGGKVQMDVRRQAFFPVNDN